MKPSRWVLPPLLLLQCVLLASTEHVASPYGKYINTPCTASSDCGLDNHLQCINNYCQCDHLTQIYDQSTHKCLLLLRQQCQAASGTITDRNHYTPPPVRCVPNADCVSGKCTCRQGYRASVDFLCKPGYGSRCYSHEDCDDSQGLICSNTLGSCQCFNSTWTYQGQFGCVDLRNPQYNEMLQLLNQTEYLLKENNLELKDIFNDLGLQNDLDTAADFPSSVMAMARQFQDTYNTNDLQFAAQNESPMQAGGGFNLQQLLTLFQTFQNLVPRNNNNGGGFGRGFFRNLFGGGNQGGYPEATTTPAPSGGYGPPGQPEGMGQRMGLLNSFLNLFNQMIPIVRQLRMRFSPVKFIRNLITRFTPTTTPAPAPAAAAIHNAPPTVIDSNGNYQSNPIFDNNPGQEQSGANNQGQSSFRFFQRTRQRFRNFLRGNNQGGGGGGGYDYTPANPPAKYGVPDKYGPPAEAPPPADSGAPPAEPASSSQSNFFTNNPRASFNEQQSQAQYSTVHVTQNGAHVQSNHNQPQQQFQSSSVPATAQRQQSFDGLPRPNTFNSGNQPNPQSFFPASPSNNNNNYHQQNNNQQHSFNHNQNNFNAQPSSQYQSSFSQTSNSIPASPPVPHNPNQSPIFDSSTNSFVRPQTPSIPQSPSIPSVPASPPQSSIPQYKLPIRSGKNIPTSPNELISQNFILSEADDPHPGFTPHSTPESPVEQPHAGFRTSARFERIGQDEQPQAQTAAQNWAETF